MTIWLTGCSSGLGWAMVGEFVKAGHTVAGCARRSDLIEALRNEFPEKNKFSVVDVSSDRESRDFCKAAFESTGSPDFLINNAAIINSSSPLWEIPAKDFDELMAINVGGTANMIRHAIPYMAEVRKGIIVNISSGWGRSTSPEVAPYCASKWAIEGLTQSLAQELPFGLAAVSLNPGIIDTKMLRSCFGEESAHYREPEEWATTAVPFILNLGIESNGCSLTAP